MANATTRNAANVIHPVHAILLAATLPLFIGALLSDLAYGSTYQIQWANFSSWLIAGGLVFAGLALAWALIDLLRSDVRWRGKPVLYLFVVAATFIVGLVNALVHAKDAWAAMPEGLILSAIVAVLALAAVAIGFSTLRRGETR